MSTISNEYPKRRINWCKQVEAAIRSYLPKLWKNVKQKDSVKIEKKKFSREDKDENVKIREKQIISCFESSWAGQIQGDKTDNIRIRKVVGKHLLFVWYTTYKFRVAGRSKLCFKRYRSGYKYPLWWHMHRPKLCQRNNWIRDQRDRVILQFA